MRVFTTPFNSYTYGKCLTFLPGGRRLTQIQAVINKTMGVWMTSYGMTIG